MLRTDEFLHLTGFLTRAKERAAMCKHLTALYLRSEAEGTRTLNLRIDSPNRGFVSVYW
jgi:hypothetical protein